MAFLNLKKDYIYGATKNFLSLGLIDNRKLVYGTEEIQKATKSKTRSRRNRIKVYSVEASSVEKGIGQTEEGALA